jgi:glutamyl-Q tRNA(Asp) synthetase
LGGKALRYAHIPVVLGADGQKLSKQNHAPALDGAQPSHNLYQALSTLGQDPPPELKHEAPETIVKWAVTHWQIALVAKVVALTA